MNIPLVALGGALGAAAASVFGVISVRRRREIRVEGRLLQWIEGRRVANRISLTPLIEFTTQDGRVLQVTGPSNDRLDSWPRDPVGSPMPVSYPPGDPERAFAGPSLQRYYLAVLLAGVAVASIVVGLVR